MRRLAVTTLIVSIFVLSSALQAFAATSWWSEAGIRIKADDAVTPADLSGKAPDAFEPDDTHQTAKPLRIGAEPQDRVIVEGDEDWYILEAEDGLGYIRIGATGPIIVEEGSYRPGENSFLGGSYTGYDGPQKGADLMETAKRSITENAVNWDVKQVQLRISTKSTTPIAYKISFVSELPENRVGGAYGPGIVAWSYIKAVAEGDLKELYRSTRVKFTADEATELREELFGLREKLPRRGFTIHTKDRSADPNITEKLPVQHIIISDEDTVTEGRHWAFVIDCEEKDGLWLAAKAKRDPELSNEEIAKIVRRDMEGMSAQITGAVPKTDVSMKADKQDTTSNLVPVVATIAAAFLAAVGIIVTSLVRRRRKSS